MVLHRPVELAGIIGNWLLTQKQVFLGRRDSSLATVGFQAVAGVVGEGFVGNPWAARCAVPF